eukprot:4499889-Prymnesium_polylepis.1
MAECDMQHRLPHIVPKKLRSAGPTHRGAFSGGADRSFGLAFAFALPLTLHASTFAPNRLLANP